ncbi:MAG TPA: ribonuclease P protein component [Rhodocyclaceae bacterium]
MHRLRRAEEFSAVFGYRKVLRGAIFDLHLLPAEITGPRLGLVVPKRLVRRSVDRNLIRRVAREVFRIRRSAMPGFDLVLRVARKLPVAREEVRPLLRQDFTALLDRLAQRAAAPTAGSAT